MPSATLNAEDLQEISQRYLKLYSGAIADILDKRGHRNQVLPRYLTPLSAVNRVAGLAFTGQGYPCASTTDDDTQTRLNMLDSITPGTVSVWACGGSVNCAHWGEMMSTAARQRGCTGGVLDGGVRDLDFINAMQYPVFAAFKCAASSVGRWNIKEYQTTIKIGDNRAARHHARRPVGRRRYQQAGKRYAGRIAPRSLRQRRLRKVRFALT
ncbi:MAG: RraA family protein [Candidatus Solibacter sp.]|nr:RraA family protein [Candidatus Solibacter sp.]